MTVNTITLCGSLAENCYTVAADNTALVIDPGECSPLIERFLKENSDKERLILITHAHFDHIGGAAELRQKTGVKIAVGEKDAPATDDCAKNLSHMFGAVSAPFKADLLLSDGRTFKVGDTEIKAIETPGHTLGGMCYLLGDCLFSGDTLFAGTVGRTDVYGGSHTALMSSLKRLVNEADADVRVYPGHGPETTIGREISRNPYLKEL